MKSMYIEDHAATTNYRVSEAATSRDDGEVDPDYLSIIPSYHDVPRDVEHHGWLLLNNAGFKSTSPYFLPEDWIRHEHLCTACEIFMNHMVVKARKIDHISEYEYVARAAAYGCFICSLVHKYLLENFGPEESEMAKHFPLQPNIYFPPYHRDWKGDLTLIENYRTEAPEPCYLQLLVPETTETYNSCQLITPKDGLELQSQVQQWMATCRETHQGCKDPPTETWPSRLLKISLTNDDPRIELIEPNKRLEYVSLSYCWGSDGPPKFLPQGKDRSENELEYATLPKTFRDAIAFTFILGFRYIWIDCLCADQDDLIESRRDLNKMQAIYRGSALTLVADGAKDRNGGLFPEKGAKPKRIGITFPLTYRIYKTDRKTCRTRIAVDHLWARQDVGKGATASRAWCVQERMLSQRLVHFTGSQVYWQCADLFACEICPDEIPFFVKARNELYCQPNFAQKIAKHLSSADSRSSWTNMWDDFVETFSKATLTYPSDRYPAMAGIVARIIEHAPQLEPEHCAGMWRSWLPEALLWQRFFQSYSKIVRRFPTWSWTSLECPIKPRNVYRSEKANATFIDATIFDAGPSGLLQPSAGRLRVEGHVFQIAWRTYGSRFYSEISCTCCNIRTRLHHDHPEQAKRRKCSDYLSGDAIAAQFTWDMEDDRLQAQDLLGFAINIAPWAEALLLKNVAADGKEPRYERRGIVRLNPHAGHFGTNQTHSFKKDDLMHLQHFKRQVLEIW